MPVISEKELKSQIKSRSFAPLYVLCGSEQLFIRQYTKLLTDAVTGKSPSDFNFHSFGGEVDLDVLASAVGVIPFMSEYNCVLVTDIFLDMYSSDALNQLKAICRMRAEGTVLIISMPSYVPQKNARAWEALQKQAQKDGCVVKFDKPTDATLEKCIAKWVTQQGKRMSRLNAAHLIKLCGNDLTRLKNEVDKLCAYTQGEEIQTAAIDKLVAQTLETRIFALSDQVLAGRGDAAFQTLHQLFYQKEEPVMMLYVLSNAFADAYRVRVADESGVQTAALAADFDYGKRTFALDKARRSTGTVTTAALRRCLGALMEADVRLKTERVNERLLLEQLIARLLLLAREGTS